MCVCPEACARPSRVCPVHACGCRCRAIKRLASGMHVHARHRTRPSLPITYYQLPSLVLQILSRPLLGPPCAHQAAPLHARYLGSDSPKDNPRAYVQAVCDIFDRYTCVVGLVGSFIPTRGRHPTPPPPTHKRTRGTCRTQCEERSAISLIINTHGWVRALGTSPGIPAPTTCPPLLLILNVPRACLCVRQAPPCWGISYDTRARTLS